MQINKDHKEAILNKMRELGYSYEIVAQGVNKSKGWVSNLLKDIKLGGMQKMKPDDVELLESFLGISLLSVNSQWTPYSKAATEYAEIVDAEPEFHKLTEQILTIFNGYKSRPRFIPSEEMSEIGQKIYELAKDLPSDSNGQRKYGKLARQVLELLA